jgi:F0F1-type ATP synthase epsilon subunit
MEKNNNQASSLARNSLYVLIRNREKIVVEEECKAITSTNEVGEFDILPSHENFITVIRDIVRIHKLDGTTQDIKIGQGVLKVFANSVTIYIDIGSTEQATTPPQINKLFAKREAPQQAAK